MKIEVIREQREAPEDVSRWLHSIGGSNWLGEPNFAIGWDADGQSTLGTPCWCLLQWTPPEEYGTPEEWPYDVLGPYPSRGRYEIIQPMPAVRGQLSYRILQALVGIIRRHQHDNFEKRKRFFDERRERKNKAMTARIADCIQDAVPEHLGPTSFSRQRVTTNEIQRRMAQIERNGPMRRLPKGMSINSLN